MRALLKNIGLAHVAVGVLLAGTAHAGAISLDVDQSAPMRFKSPVSGVVVGNAGVADVIVHDSKTLLFVGKSVGSTHVLAVDRRGRTVFNGEVTVRAPEPQGLLTVQRGMNLSTSICDTRCITFPHSEATTAEINEAAARATARSGFASGGGK